MSIAKCFSNLNNAELSSMFETNLENGMTQDAAAAAAIADYAKLLSDKNNTLREKLGLPKAKAPNTKALRDLVENPSETIGSMPEDLYILTEPDVEVTQTEDTEVDEDKITFTHKLANGRTTSSFMEALIQSQEGAVIEMGFKVGDEFLPLASTRKSTNRNTVDGFISFMVEAGAIAEQKVPNMQGDLVFQAAGNSELRQAFTTALLRDQAPAYLGTQAVKQDGFTFTIEDNADNVTVIGRNGELAQATLSELDQMTFQELEQKYGRFTAIITVAEREYSASQVHYRSLPKSQLAEAVMEEEELQLQLMNLLNKLGVKVTTITEYNKKYKMRHGVNPSAKALADIANQVIALSEGNLESLSEEAAHFVNEALPQDMVRNVLRNVHKSEEWAQFSEVYREIYRNEYPEDQLEEVVRREVLGKIIAKVLSEPTLRENAKNETQRNFFQRAWDFVMEFAKSIAQKFQPSYKQELEAYKNEVRKLMTSEEIANQVELDNFKYNTFRFYDLEGGQDAIDRLLSTSRTLARKLHDAEKTLLNAGVGSRTNLKELERIQEDLKNEQNISSISGILSMMKNATKRLNLAIDESEKDTNSNYLFTSEENLLYQFVKGFGRKGIDDVKYLMKEAEKIATPQQKRAFEIMKQTANELAVEIGNLESRASLIDSKNVQYLVQTTMEKYDIPEHDRELVQGWIEKAKSDTSIYHYAFGQLVHAQDGLLNLTGLILRRMNHEAGVKFYYKAKAYQDRLKELGVTEQDISKFVDGNFILSEYDWNKFTEDSDRIYAETYVQAVLDDIARMKQMNAEEATASDTIAENNKEIARYESFLSELGYSPENVYRMEAEDRAKMVAAFNKMKVDRKLIPLTLEGQTMRKNMERQKLTKPDDGGAPLIVRAMKDEYYDKYEEKLDQAGVSQSTRQALSNLMSDIGDIRKKAYTRVNGKLVLDYTTLSESDLMMLKEFQMRRKAMKSYYKNGDLKQGLEFVYDRNGNPILDENGNPRVELNPDLVASGQVPAEAAAAIDLNNLDALFEKDNQEKSAQLFFETLDKIDQEQGREAALKFLDANTFVNFSQDFWTGLGKEETLIDKLKRYRDIADPSEYREIDRLIKSITFKSFTIKSLIKQHTKKSNPAEVDVDLMEQGTMDQIKNTREKLQDDLAKANGMVRDMETEVSAERTVEAVSEVNAAYMQLMDDLDLLDHADDPVEVRNAKASQEVNEAVKHMTPQNAATVNSAKYGVQRFANGLTDALPKIAQDILDDMGRDKNDLKTDEMLMSEVWRTMARSRVLPYYKRFAPAQYNEFVEGLSTAENLSEYLQGQKAKDAFVEVTPNYSFFDQSENEMINPEYDREFKGGYRQPNLARYNNPKFAETFGNVQDGQASKNNNLYQAYLATLQFNEESLEAMNVGENYNKFRLPQIRKNKVERFMKLLKGNPIRNVRNAVVDTLRFTEDDMIKGESMFGDNAKVIPKMYVSELQDPDDISTELFYSLTMRAREGYLREAKVRHYGDIMSLQDKILSREMNGKQPDKSNTYKMFKSAVDYNIFGVKEVYTSEINIPLIGKVDIAKLGRIALSYIKMRNLGFNLVIPYTSWITGDITRKMEAMVGDYVDLDSQAKGRNEFARLAPDGMKEMGVINTRAKINTLGQLFGAFDIMDSFQNSDYSKLGRMVPRMAMGLHTAANYPLYGTTLMGILYDFRVTDSGEVMDLNQFRNRNGVTGKLSPELKKQWKETEGNAIYNYLVHDGNSIKWDKAKLMTSGRDGAPAIFIEGRPIKEEELDKYLEDLLSRIQGKVQFVNSIIDGQIPEQDRVLAQRHFLWSAVMTHRGWLSINIARRFKNRHLNLETQTVEEGSYRTLGAYLARVAEGVKQDPAAFLAQFKKQWDEASPVERRNMRRVMIEFATLNAIMLFAVLLMAAADDEPENEALSAAAYAALRPVNELIAVQSGIFSQVMETVSDPFVGWNTMKNWLKVGDLLSDEEVKYGTYRGMTERERWLTRMAYGVKQGFDLSNMDETYKTYKFYNRSNFNKTVAGYIYANSIGGE